MTWGLRPRLYATTCFAGFELNTLCDLLAGYVGLFGQSHFEEKAHLGQSLIELNARLLPWYDHRHGTAATSAGGVGDLHCDCVRTPGGTRWRTFGA